MLLNRNHKKESIMDLKPKKELKTVNVKVFFSGTFDLFRVFNLNKVQIYIFVEVYEIKSA